MPLLTICQQIWKVSKAQISKIIQSSESFGSCLDNLGKTH